MTTIYTRHLKKAKIYFARAPFDVSTDNWPYSGLCLKLQKKNSPDQRFVWEKLKPRAFRYTSRAKTAKNWSNLKNAEFSKITHNSWLTSTLVRQSSIVSLQYSPKKFFSLNWYITLLLSVSLRPFSTTLLFGPPTKLLLKLNVFSTLMSRFPAKNKWAGLEKDKRPVPSSRISVGYRYIFSIKKPLVNYTNYMNNQKQKMEEVKF